MPDTMPDPTPERAHLALFRSTDTDMGPALTDMDLERQRRQPAAVTVS